MNKNIRDIRLVFLIFSGIFSLAGYKTYGTPWSFIFLAVTVILLLTLTFSPLTLEPLLKLWIKISSAIGWVNTRILLGVFFYIVLTPVGLFMKMTGQNKMFRKTDRESYWDSCELSGITDTDRYKKQF